jgi:hypothetical protein
MPTSTEVFKRLSHGNNFTRAEYLKKPVNTQNNKGCSKKSSTIFKNLLDIISPMNKESTPGHSVKEGRVW